MTQEGHDLAREQTTETNKVQARDTPPAPPTATADHGSSDLGAQSQYFSSLPQRRGQHRAQPKVWPMVTAIVVAALALIALACGIAYTAHINSALHETRAELADSNAALAKLSAEHESLLQDTKNASGNDADSSTDAVNSSQKDQQAQQDKDKLEQAKRQEEAQAQKVQDAKNGLNATLGKARTALSHVEAAMPDSTLATKLESGLQSAIDSGQKLLDSNEIKDASVYTSAQNALEQLISGVEELLGAQ